MTQKRAAQRGKGRKFFQEVQPTFAVELPITTTNLEFLDENDPGKSTIVRKKAREWVNRNKDTNRKSKKKLQHSRLEDEGRDVDSAGDHDMQLHRRKSSQLVVKVDLMQTVGAGQLDPFNILPHVGRKYDHIIKYFEAGVPPINTFYEQARLTELVFASCPEEVPCSDDKYGSEPKHSLTSFSSENSILGNALKSEVSFVLWLYATVSIRDGVTGSFCTEEVHWFYNKALRIIQSTLQKEVDSGKFSDGLLNALACLTAVASFSGMFSTAVLHRDAMIRVLELRGNGDVLKGLRCTHQWTSKAIQWCEIMVATQLIEVPKIPYYHAFLSKPFPEKLTYEAERRTAITLLNVHPLSEPLQHIVRLLHQLGVGHSFQSPGMKVDPYIIGPLYDAQYFLLQILQTHKETDNLSDMELLLAETFQLYFETGPRGLPPHGKSCDLFLARITKALSPLLRETESEDVETALVTSSGSPSTHPVTTDIVPRTLHHSVSIDNAIAWSLSLATIVSAVQERSEHLWLKKNLQAHLKAMGLERNKEKYCQMLDLFPTTNCFVWIDLSKSYAHFLA